MRSNSSQREGQTCQAYTKQRQKTNNLQGKPCRFESIIENQNKLIHKSDLEQHQAFLEIESFKLKNVQFLKKFHDEGLENTHPMKMRNTGSKKYKPLDWNRLNYQIQDIFHHWLWKK